MSSPTVHLFLLNNPSYETESVCGITLREVLKRSHLWATWETPSPSIRCKPCFRFHDLPVYAREALLTQVAFGKTELAEEIAGMIRNADKTTREDMLAFFKSGGPEKVQAVREKFGV